MSAGGFEDYRKTPKGKVTKKPKQAASSDDDEEDPRQDPERKGY